MSMTRADAKNYIARVLSAVQSQQAQIWAEESIQRAFTDFQLARNWEFLLKDTSNTRFVGSIGYQTNLKTYTVAYDGQFDGLNIGQTLSSIAFAGGNNVIAGLTYDSTGRITAFTLKDFPTSSITAQTNCTDDIVIVPGQEEYNLPPDFYAPSTTRILGDAGRKIDYIRNGLWYRAAVSPETPGVVDFYSLFNPHSAATTGNGITRMRLRYPPSEGGTIRMEYFRAFNKDSDQLDIPDDFLYKFLDYCRALILESRSAAEQPLVYAQRALAGLASAAMADSEVVDDEEIALHSQMSVYAGNRRLWSNGAYDAEA
jgi:hypothetical protein